MGYTSEDLPHFFSLIPGQENEPIPLLSFKTVTWAHLLLKYIQMLNLPLERILHQHAVTFPELQAWVRDHTLPALWQVQLFPHTLLPHQHSVRVL